MTTPPAEQAPNFDADFAETMQRCAAALTQVEQTPDDPTSHDRRSTAIALAAIAVEMVVTERELHHRPDQALSIFVDGLQEHGKYRKGKVTDVTTWSMLRRAACSRIVISDQAVTQSHAHLLSALLRNQGAHLQPAIPAASPKSDA